MKKQLLTLITGASLYSMLIVPCSSNAQVPSYIPSNGLVAWWPFNGNANDESGNGNNGTVSGATLTTDRFGNPNKAYSFDGSSNYIDCGPLSAIPNTVGDITQSAWILAPLDQTPYCKMAIMSKRQVITQGWPTIGGGSNGGQSFPVVNQAYFFLNSQNYAAGVANAMHSTSLTNDGNWHLVTGVKSGSNYKLFFDGVLQASLTDSYSLTSNSNLIIGHEAQWGFDCERWYSGKLDDIAIWNRALTDQEVVLLYQGCSGAITSQPVNQTINVSTGMAQFSVSTSATSPNYQWQTNLGVGFQNLSNVGQYSGVTTNTLTVSNVSLSNNNQPFRCIINSGGCTDTSDVAVLTVVNNAGLEEQQATSISVYPNPAKDELTILQSDTKEENEFQLLDASGRIVMKGELTEKLTSISLKGFDSGTYLLKVGTDSLPVRVVKE
jgi:hypothetical protein